MFKVKLDNMYTCRYNRQVSTKSCIKVYVQVYSDIPNTNIMPIVDVNAEIN